MDIKATIDSAIHSHEATSALQLAQELLRHPEVSKAVAKARAAGIPILQILVTLLPFALQILAGGAVDWQAIINAILALIKPAA